MQELTKNRKRRRRPNWPVRGLYFALFFSFLIFCLFVPTIQFRIQASELQRERWDLLTRLILTSVMGWFLVHWVFFVGACLGSFLNVVAFRIPNKMTILGSSRCPRCLVPIKLKNNLPIFGWLILRGRCAACRLSIAIRYMLVEIVAGIILVWLFAFELAANGVNLPREHDYQIERLFRQLASNNFDGIWNRDWSLVRIFLIHSIVAYTTLTAALMRLDRLKLPNLWKSIHLLVPMIWIAIWPSDFEFARADFQLEDRFGEWLSRLDFQFVGICVGGYLGYQMQQLAGDRDSGILFCFAMIGLTCGLAATVSIGVIFLLLYLVFLSRSRSSFLVRNPLFTLLAAFLVQIAFWSRLDGLAWWPSNSASSLILIAYLIPGTAAVIWFTSRKRSKKSMVAQPNSETSTVDSGQTNQDENRSVESGSTGDGQESGTQ